MKRLGDKPKKAILSAHVIFVAVWLGTSICSLILLLFQPETSDLTQLSTVRSIVRAFFFGLLIPSAIGSIKTGILLSVFTHWGLTKHYWIMVKWIVSASMIAWLTLFIGKWLFINSTSLFNQDMVVVGFIVQTFLLLMLVVISVFKPWGKVAKAK
ncbi:hypothetical protein FZC66_16535 [Priestia megaterium]|nr:hypothetical protein FZC66_16535 [Priestia megaterium]